MDDSNQTVNQQPVQSSNDDLSSEGYRRLIGSIGLFLPILLWLLAIWRDFSGTTWTPLGSISAYYYSGAVSAFAGMLIALGLFLFTYRGYRNNYKNYDRIAAAIAGFAAIVVALFPTGAPSDALKLSWWKSWIGTLHFSAAATLFAAFIFFAVIQFPRSDTKGWDKLPWDKKLRNIIYYVCGGAMAACMAWAVIEVRRGGHIFWPEALALEFFAISWLVKGRVDKPVVAAGKKTINYARHPQELVDEVKRAVHPPQEVPQYGEPTAPHPHL